jgi:uncharacterized protein
MKRVSGLVRYLGLLLAVCAGPVLAQGRGPKDGQPLFLWKATSPTNTVYLFGSVHVGEKGLYPLPAEVERAFARAKALVLEVDVTKVDEAALLRLIVDKGSHPNGQTVWKELSKKTAARLKKYCAEKKLPLDKLEKFRPWMIYLALYELEVKDLGLSEQYGIDSHFAVRAKKARLPVLELETAEAQINLLAGFPPELQEKLLSETVEGSHTKDMTRKMIAAWKAGDVKTMEEEVLRAPVKEDKAFKPVLEKMFDERNVEMAKKIAGYLEKKGEPYFVVVGAGHLVGEKGIPQLLRARGYKVEQLRHSAEKQDGK